MDGINCTNCGKFWTLPTVEDENGNHFCTTECYEDFDAHNGTEAGAPLHGEDDIPTELLPFVAP